MAGGGEEAFAGSEPAGALFLTGLAGAAARSPSGSPFREGRVLAAARLTGGLGDVGCTSGGVVASPAAAVGRLRVFRTRVLGSAFAGVLAAARFGASPSAPASLGGRFVVALVETFFTGRCSPFASGFTSTPDLHGHPDMGPLGETIVWLFGADYTTERSARFQPCLPSAGKNPAIRGRPDRLSDRGGSRAGALRTRRLWYPQARCGRQRWFRKTSKTNSSTGCEHRLSPFPDGDPGHRRGVGGEERKARNAGFPERAWDRGGQLRCLR